MAKKVTLATALNKSLGKRARTRSSLKTAGHLPASLTTPTQVGHENANGSGVFAIGRILSNVVYGTCYCASFGVVFASMMVLQLIPTENALGHGLKDGGRAAQDAFRKWRAPSRPETPRGAEAHSPAAPEYVVHA